MFNIFKKAPATIELRSICNGKIVSIEEVPDITFSQKLLGDGIAFTYEEDTLYAPCDAEVLMIANTKHAIGLKAKNGAELLIHAGLDTVNFNGKGLSILVKMGQKIKVGTPILEIDMDFMKENNINMITPLIITNSSDFNLTIKNQNTEVSVNDFVISLKKKQ